MIKVADEVWIATALLHREHPERTSFRVGEIVERVCEAGLSPNLRPGVQVHASAHCVANKRPNPGNYRMLYATPERERRLFRPGDDYHPYREGGKIVPRAEEIPPDCLELLTWYQNEYARTVDQPSADAGTTPVGEHFPGDGRGEADRRAVARRSGRVGPQPVGEQPRAGCTPSEQPRRRRRPWEIALALIKRVPPEELDKLPVDLAEQHDHYASGAPKR